MHLALTGVDNALQFYQLKVTAESELNIKYDILGAFLVISYGGAQARINWKSTVEIITFEYRKDFLSLSFSAI